VSFEFTKVFFNNRLFIGRIYTSGPTKNLAITIRYWGWNCYTFTVPWS